jgi:hypothetical protein
MPRTTKSPNPFAVSLCTGNSPIICDKKESSAVVNTPHNFNIRAFLKENKFKKKLTITVYAQNVSLLVLKNFKILEKIVSLV